VVDIAQAVIETANGLVDTVDKVKTFVLGDLEKQIQDMNLKVDGITAEYRKLIEEALKELYQSKVHIDRTSTLLELLADETIRKVDDMVLWLKKVDPNWDEDKIRLFLKFQAKSMADLVERSMTHLHEVDKLYSDIQMKLGTIKAKLVSFQTYVEILTDENSQAFKDKKKDIRMKVYIPCCATLVGCPFCVATLETYIKGWQRDLDNLKNTLWKNGQNCESILNDVNDTSKFLSNEIKLVLKWQSALIDVANIDYYPDEAEIFGFAEARPRIVSSLQNLRLAAENYLQSHAQSTTTENQMF